MLLLSTISKASERLCLIPRTYPIEHVAVIIYSIHLDFLPLPLMRSVKTVNGSVMGFILGQTGSPSS